jgi:hypothetical protein
MKTIVHLILRPASPDSEERTVDIDISGCDITIEFQWEEDNEGRP